MGSYHPFGHLKHKLWPKERPGVKLTVWLLTIKGRESTWFLACRWRATYCWKVLNEGYNFALDFISIWGLHTKLSGSKSWESQIWQFRDSHLGILGQKAIWMWASWRSTKYTIRGKVVASPKSGLWWILWVQVCSWFCPSTKSVPTMH